MGQLLGPRLTPPGPVIDGEAAERVRDELAAAAGQGGWSDQLDAAWSALAPMVAASPYLASLIRRRPERLGDTLGADPEARLAEIIAATEALAVIGVDADDSAEAEAYAALRRLKRDVHLTLSLADLGGLWNAKRVTQALSDFADAAVRASLAMAAQALRRRGKLISAPDDPRGPLPGLFGLAMGKHGAGELNYSSDIDLSLFYDPEITATAFAEGLDVQTWLTKLAQSITRLLSERSGDGYVFRLDLRLRPDPSTTPPIVAAPAALAYYESVGQNWERAAFIKARPVCGDTQAARAFLDELEPFVWRRSLDYQAIADVHSIKRQIHAHKTGEGLTAAGANLKLGRGGIREIEFFAQTQQLILGGRDRRLRAPRTDQALAALADAGHLEPATGKELTAAYWRLRDLEHRVQMREDEQTHALPEDDDARRAVAALSGADDLATFDAEVEALLIGVNRRYGELFSDEEDLSSPYGSLVFTGVEDDPETLATLERMGFSNPPSVAATIRGWHHGRINATRTARGRELFTRLAPKLLTVAAETGAPDRAFRRFSTFFEQLSGGVQVMSLFLAQPALFETVVRVMAFAPRLARTLGRSPAALDSVLDARFDRDIAEDSGVLTELAHEVAAAPDLETAMNVVRRITREQRFRIGMQVVTGRAELWAAGEGYADLADAAIRALSPHAWREIEARAGAFPGAVAVVALGKAGSREMTAGSDLDLMTVYRAEAPDAASDKKSWSADVVYGRFTQRLIAALSAPTSEGELYQVDMRLRPSGSAGPVAVSLPAFRDYYASEADTWEVMALTRARVVWADDDTFATEVEDAIAEALTHPRDPATVRHDAREMRALMTRERPPSGFWDLKLNPGAQVDCEFAAQMARLTGLAPLGVSTLEALATPGIDPALGESWRLHQTLNQVINACFRHAISIEEEPEGFQNRLARLVGEDDFAALHDHLATLRTRAHAAWTAMVD